ncbi:MAG: hypothetical protein K6E33_00420 [Lachnospiraceae bacterium]|nr:hypothetical protein [Lachnospiraceae bacterium]
MKFKERYRNKRLIVKCGSDFFLPFGIILGFYVIAFGTISPGGGFQGGVLVASAVLLLYLGYGFNNLVKALKPEALRVGEALGAIIYVLLGMLGIFAGANFCRNIIFDQGEVGDMISAGNITFMSYAVGFKVLTGIGFLLILMLGLMVPGKSSSEIKETKTEETAEEGTK